MFVLGRGAGGGAVSIKFRAQLIAVYFDSGAAVGEVTEVPAYVYTCILARIFLLLL